MTQRITDAAAAGSTGNAEVSNETPTPSLVSFVPREPTEAMMNVVAALRALSAMYGYTWDHVEGDLVMMGDGVHRFEKAHAMAQRALREWDAAATAQGATGRGAETCTCGRPLIIDKLCSVCDNDD